MMIIILTGKLKNKVVFVRTGMEVEYGDIFKLRRYNISGG